MKVQSEWKNISLLFVDCLQLYDHLMKAGQDWIYCKNSKSKDCYSNYCIVVENLVSRRVNKAIIFIQTCDFVYFEDTLINIDLIKINVVLVF